MKSSKLYITIISLSAVLFLGLIYYLNVENREPDKSAAQEIIKSELTNTEPTRYDDSKNQDKSIAKIEKENTGKKYLGYHVLIRNSIQTNLQQGSTNTPTQVEMAFDVIFESLRDGQSGQRGVIKNLVISSPTGVIDEDIRLSSESLGFLYTFNKPQIYQDIDLLGLPYEHPLGIFAFYLSNLSYTTNPVPVKFDEPTRSTTYQYWINNGEKTVARQLLDVVYTEQLPYGSITDDIDDDWKAIIAEDALIKSVEQNTKMSADILLNVAQNNQQQSPSNSGFKVAIEISGEYTRFEPTNVSFPANLFAHNANARFLKDMEAYAVDDDITSDQQYYEELAKLSSSLSYTDSIRVGEYLLAYKSLSEIKGMLSDDTLTPLERQAILMAIQDANKPESEQYLASIITDSDVPDRYRTAGMVNLALVKDATSTAMNAFVDVITQNEAPLLTETAMLNIANLAREKPDLANRGVDIVSEALTNPDATQRDKLIALRAAANLDNNEFTSSFISSLQSDSPFERTAAVEGALYRPDGRLEAVEHLMTEEDTVVITGAARFYNTQEMSFFEQNKFYGRLLTEPSETVQSAIATVLLSNESQRPQMLTKLLELSASGSRPGIEKVLLSYELRAVNQSSGNAPP